MDESAYLRIRQQDPENEEVRAAYFAWFAKTQDPRAKYVRLMQERSELAARLEQVDGEIHFFHKVPDEWLEIAFPLRVRSPTVGRVYLRPTPDSPPFVAPGAVVAPETVVCLVEVMKTFCEVVAGVNGVVDHCAVANGAPIEFNQVLFR
jgi:biotin carboxyl carrier protein